MGKHLLNRLLLAGGLVALLARGVDAQGTLLVSSNAERRVVMIDLKTEKVVATFPSPQGPHEIALSQDHSRAFVADSGTGPGGSSGNSIVVLDPEGRSTMATFKGCEQPHDTRVSRDGRMLWVACAPMKAVLELDARNGSV